jgi:hypothetical protein
MRTIFLALMMLAVGTASASADEVVLRNGSSFSGAVREDGDRVTIEMDSGTITFKKVDVRSVTRGDDVVKTFDERAAKASGSKELVDVALWGRDHGLKNRSDDLLERVLRVDPDQPDARRILGYERVNGLWLRGDDLKIAQGLVKLDGKWMSGQDAQRELQRRESARIESDRNALDARVADQKHEEEMVRLALERERLEIERKVAEAQAAELERLRIEAERREYSIRAQGPLPADGPAPATTPAPVPAPAPTPVKPAPPVVRPLPPPTTVPIPPPSVTPRPPEVRQPPSDKDKDKKEDDAKKR